MKFQNILPMRIAKIGYIVVSVLFCIVGIVFLANMNMFSDLNLFLGIMLLVFGIIKIVGFYSRDLYRLAFQYDLPFGILLIIMGLSVILHFSEASCLLVIGTGMINLVDGVFKIKIAEDAKDFGIERWQIILIQSVITGITGILAIVFFSAQVPIVSRIMGTALIAEGILNLLLAIVTVKIVKKQYSDNPVSVNEMEEQ